MLNREPMWLKYGDERADRDERQRVSVLNREPMWLKCLPVHDWRRHLDEFQCSTVSRCG